MAGQLAGGKATSLQGPRLRLEPRPLSSLLARGGRGQLQPDRPGSHVCRPPASPECPEPGALTQGSTSGRLEVNWCQQLGGTLQGLLAAARPCSGPGQTPLAGENIPQRPPVQPHHVPSSTLSSGTQALMGL